MPLKRAGRYETLQALIELGLYLRWRAYDIQFARNTGGTVSLVNLLALRDRSVPDAYAVVGRAKQHYPNSPEVDIHPRRWGVIAGASKKQTAFAHRVLPDLEVPVRLVENLGHPGAPFVGQTRGSGIVTLIPPAS